jgi:hypothetical protein
MKTLKIVLVQNGFESRRLNQIWDQTLDNEEREIENKVALRQATIQI